MSRQLSGYINFMKKANFLVACLIGLFAVALLSGHAMATPDGPPSVRNERRAEPVPSIDHLPKATEIEKKAMLEAVRRIIRAELAGEEEGDFSKPLEREFLDKLPRDFAKALVNVWTDMNEIMKYQPIYYDYMNDRTRHLTRNWLILEAYCLRDLGISLEWESMIAERRLFDRLDDYVRNPDKFNQHKQNDDQSTLMPQKDGSDENGKKDSDELYTNIQIVGDTESASETERKAIFDWYRKIAEEYVHCALKEDLQGPYSILWWHGDSASYENPGDQVPRELKKLVEEERAASNKLNEFSSTLSTTESWRLKDSERHELRELQAIVDNARYELEVYLIKQVGLSHNEYTWKLHELFYRSLQKEMKMSLKEIRSELQGEDQKKLRNAAIKTLLKKWLQEGFPNQENPGQTEYNPVD